MSPVLPMFTKGPRLAQASFFIIVWVMQVLNNPTQDTQTDRK